MATEAQQDKQQERLHSIIQGFALLCVAVTSGFIMYMRWWETNIVAGSDWCDRALGASKGVVRTLEASGACFNLLNKQLDAVAFNSKIDSGVQALCLLVLVVIVLAGGKLQLAASKAGLTAGIAREELPERAAGAKEVAAVAEQRADEIAAETAPQVAPAAGSVPQPLAKQPGTAVLE